MSTVEENQREWLAALRSGDFKQGQGTLRDCEGGYCCLGVAAKVIDDIYSFENEHKEFVVSFHDYTEWDKAYIDSFSEDDETPEESYLTSTLPEESQRKLGINTKTSEYLACMNDGGSSCTRVTKKVRDFTFIARFLEIVFALSRTGESPGKP